GCLRCPARYLAKREDHGGAIVHKRFSQSREPVELAFGEAHIDVHVLAIDEPVLRERGAQLVRSRIPYAGLGIRLCRRGTEPADDRDVGRSLLRGGQSGAAGPQCQGDKDPSHEAPRRRGRCAETPIKSYHIARRSWATASHSNPYDEIASSHCLPRGSELRRLRCNYSRDLR